MKKIIKKLKLTGCMGILLMGLLLSACSIKDMQQKDDAKRSVLADNTTSSSEKIIKADEDDNASQSDEVKKEEKNIVMSIGGGAYCFAINGDDKSQLSETADAIVSGTVKDITVSCDNQGTVYSMYKVEVSEVYKGKYNDKEIYISDFGGIISAKEYFSKQEDPKMEKYKKNATGKNDYVKYQPNGAELPDVGDECIWYLEKGEKNEEGYSIYTPVCSFEGVFIKSSKDTYVRTINSGEEEKSDLGDLLTVN